MKPNIKINKHIGIKNVRIYGLKASKIASGYPMTIGEPKDFEDIKPKDNKIIEKIDHRCDILSGCDTGEGDDNFLKGIIVQFDLRYNSFFTPQLQRYNFTDIVSSQSKMHKLTRIQGIKNSCNSYVADKICQEIDKLINLYNTWTDTENPAFILFFGEPRTFRTKRQLFYCILSNLPQGFEQWMRVSTNYLQLKTIYKQRKKHRLYDWEDFCEFIELLPESNLIISNYAKRKQ